ncbi:MAG: AMP-binding protein [Burkholderiales bacterium]|jgi:2,3-dihydroxybenzoate-AMP ligase|nr:AMP-binding protein [Burkholderiales bacterium]
MEGFVDWPPELAAHYRARGLWEGLTVGEMFAQRAARWPEKVALVQGERRWTYSELLARSRELAARFAGLGLQRGDRVLMQLPNSVDFVVSYLALNFAGVIPVMALRAHRHAEVRHFLRASGACAYLVPDVIGSFDFREMAREMQAEFPSLREVIVAGEPAAGQRGLDRLPDAPPLASGPSSRDVSTMLLSGGTTSLSKLIPRTHDDYVLNARLCGAAAGFDAHTVFLAILPLGHNYNLASPGMLGAFYHGGTVVLAGGTSVEEILAVIERERVSVVASVVPLITAWLNSDSASAFDLASLAVVQNGGARLPPELRRRLRERFGCTPQEIYGTAEGLINMTRLDDPEELLLESSGAPVCDADEIRVVDDDGRDLPDGEPGELVTRGPYTIRGYFNAPDKNREAFLPGGWYRMGDVVRKRGRYVYTEGRRKDMINRGGEKVSCEEVENLILKHPKVKSAVLVAMPDPVFGEKACACVITQPGESLGFDELVAFLRGQQIASFKLPERLEVFAELPVSPVGKILKRELRDIVASRVEAERGPRSP